MLSFLINEKVSKLLTGVLVNVSSAYFIAAALTPSGATGNMESIIINFSFNLFAAIMYFTLAVGVDNLYE